MSTILEKPRLGPLQVSMWPFQDEGVDAVRAEFVKGIRRTLLHIFTGGGKTIIAMAIARRVVERGGRVLFMAATDELCDQAMRKADYLGIEAGLEKARSYARAMWNPDLVVTCVPTMSLKRLAQWPPDYFNMLIVDECHHAISVSYKRILSHFRKAWVLGLTATVDRGDNEDLGAVFESIAFVRDLPFAWNAPPPGPYACDILPVQHDLGIDLRDLRKSAKDFTDSMLEARIFPHIEALANLMKQEAGERSSLIFLPQVASATAMATALQNLGVNAEWSAGDDPNRKIKVERYQNGEIQMLASCALFCEGFDAPRTSALGMYRPTRSRNLYAQQAGRGVRLYPGKTNCLLIDPGFLANEHDLVTPAELCDSPDLDSELCDVIEDLLTKNSSLTLNRAMEQAKDVYKERTIIRIAAKEREIRAHRISYSLKDVYNTLGLPYRTPGNPIYMGHPASDKQKAFLAKRGIQDVENMSKSQAGRLIGKIFERMDADLASHKQVATLIKFGVEPDTARNTKFKDASAQIDVFFKGNGR